MVEGCGAYLSKIREIVRAIELEEGANIERGASLLTWSVQKGGLIHIFGTGHSHVFAEEAFFRAGGLACISPMLEPSLMLHTGALKSSILESCGGLAEAVFEHFQPKPPDSLILFSNSGVSPVVLRTAALARERGVSSIGVGSKRYIEYLKSRRNCQSVMEYCDVFIDNKGEAGDACVEIEGLEGKMAPTSTIAGTLILYLLLIETVSLLLRDGFVPPVFMSNHLPGGKEKNEKVISYYRGRVRML
ncbi:MAG: sugar isomerase domain-containing protein [Candidatus Caldatribacteriaceae bacterium]